MNGSDGDGPNNWPKNPPPPPPEFEFHGEAKVTSSPVARSEKAKASPKNRRGLREAVIVYLPPTVMGKIAAFS